MTPVRTLRPPSRSSISVTCPTVTPETSVIAFNGPGVPSKGTPRSRALGSAAKAVPTPARQVTSRADINAGGNRFMAGSSGRSYPTMRLLELNERGAIDACICLGRGWGMSQRDAAGSTDPGRELGFWMCTALVVGNTIGIGIFLLPASLAPYGFNALVGWGITVVGMTVLARVFSRLARQFPQADGPYAYMRSTLGEWPAFIALWCYWISCWITNSALAVGVVGYLGSAIPSLAGVPPLVAGDVAAVALRRLQPARCADRGARAGGDHGAEAAADGGRDFARSVAAVCGACRVHAQPALDAARVRLDAGGIHHRALRHARRRVRGGTGGQGTRRVANDPASDHGRHAADGCDLCRGLGSGHHVDSPAGTRGLRRRRSPTCWTASSGQAAGAGSRCSWS